MRIEAQTTEPRPNLIKNHLAKIVVFAACEFACLGIGVKSYLEGTPPTPETWAGLALLGAISGAMLAITSGELMLRVASGTLRLVTGQISTEERMSEFLRLFWEPKETSEDYDPNIA